VCGLSLIEIKKIFNFETYTAVRMFNIAVKNKIYVDRGFQKKDKKKFGYQ